LLSLLFDAANQSFLPRLVPRELLIPAHARLEQSDSVAQTVGPLLAGALIQVVGAPVAMLVDAASYLFSGALLASISVTERAQPVERRNLRAELREGLSWVYRHRTLASMAMTSHAWFLFHSMLSTVFVAYVLDVRELDLGAFWLGVAYACGGVGAFLGGALAGWAGRRFDAGPTMIAAHALMAPAWILVPLAVPGPAAFVMVALSQFLFWVVMGITGPNELGYRQSVTPDGLQGRMNTTIRSLNRAAIVVGAPLGGFLAVAVGYRTALWVGIAGFALVALAMAISPFRHARYSDALEPNPEPDLTVG
jgi:predicted MFS family arabinose efflux permease